MAPFVWWGAIKLDGDPLLWVPDWKAIGAQVTAGRLPGKVDKDGNVSLDTLTPQQADSLTTVGMLLWDSPIRMTHAR